MPTSFISRTRVLKVSPESPEPSVLEEAARILRAGGLVAFPTETVYGLGADALNAEAVRRIFAAKGRPAGDPLIVHISRPDQLTQITGVRAIELFPLIGFWPGPLTLILPRGPAVPLEVTAGLETVAVRMPAHPVALALIEAAGTPIAAPSANRFTRPSPTRAEHVLEDLAGRFDLLLDGGPATHGVESTVLDLCRQPPRVLRPGAIPAEDLLEVLPARFLVPMPTAPAAGIHSPQSSGLATPAPQVPGSDAPGSEGPPIDAVVRSPGTHLKHYAPRSPLRLFIGPPLATARAIRAAAEAALERGERVGVLADDAHLSALGRVDADSEDGGASSSDPSALPRGPHLVSFRLGRRGDLVSAGRLLYAGLRALDTAGVSVILTHGFPARGLGSALQDRLFRAAEGRVELVEE